MSEHPYLRLDETVHQRVRLGILSVLAVGQASFTELRDTLAQPDGSLSRHLGVLADAGFVTIEKTFQDRKPRTLVEITPQGRAALRDEFATVRNVAEFANGSRTTFSIEAQWRPFVLNTVPVEFELAMEYPISGSELTGVVHPEFGIRGGYNRRWVREGASIEILFLELDDPSAPAAVVGALGGTVGIPDFPAARAREVPGSSRVWFSRERFLVCVTATGPDAGALAPDIAWRQHEVMDTMFRAKSAARSAVRARVQELLSNTTPSQER